ncbi:E3 ubiquitin-protein ligase TRIM39-like isoform X1 [Arapaima gigas]
MSVSLQPTMAENDTEISLADDLDMTLWPGRASATVSLGNQRNRQHVPSPKEMLNAEMTTQPYPRSPKAIRKIISAGGTQAKEVLSRRLEELEVEQSRAEAHLQSLKKRSSDLTRSAETMKLQVNERYESMRHALQKDEQAALDAVEQEHREASARLSEILRDWKQHLCQVQRDIANTRRVLHCHKKKEAVEEHIKMNENHFQKLLKILRSILNNLETELQRKSFMLDASAVQIDRQSCHRHIALPAGGRQLCFSNEAKPAAELPMQFDKVYCALGSTGMTTGRHYWEVDVRYCTAWALGAAYGCMERKGQGKGAKLGRNAHSWCLELRDGNLSAWHNDRGVTCRLAGFEPPRRVGILLDHIKGRLAFYDASSMKLLQEFSAALTPMFDRTQHHFTGAVFPAFRFFKPETGQPWSNHMEICHLGL